jgi:hypothetical protein
MGSGRLLAMRTGDAIGDGIRRIENHDLASSGSRPGEDFDGVAEVAPLNDALELDALLAVDSRDLQAGGAEQHGVGRQAQGLRVGRSLKCTSA